MYKIINKLYEIWIRNKHFTKEHYGKMHIFYKKFFELDIIRSSQALAFISFLSIVPIYAFFFFILAILSKKDADKLTDIVGKYVFPEYIDARYFNKQSLQSKFLLKNSGQLLPFF